MEPLSGVVSQEVPLAISTLSDLGKGALRKALLKASSSQSIDDALSLWVKLVLTASSPQVNDKHITAASNTLCVFLTAGVASQATAIRQLALSREAWFDAFRCAHKAFNDGKTKPAFQIMDTLSALLQNQPDAGVAAEILDTAAAPLIEVLLLGSPRSDIKKASLLLSCLCRSTALIPRLDRLVARCINSTKHAWQQRLIDHNIPTSKVDLADEGSIFHLCLALVFTMLDLDTRSASLKLFSLLHNQQSASRDGESKAYDRPKRSAIESFLDRNPAAAGSFAEHVLPTILKTKAQVLAFVKPYSMSSSEIPSRLAVSLAVVKVARANAILSESGMCIRLPLSSITLNCSASQTFLM
jgi:hypothetical protein